MTIAPTRGSVSLGNPNKGSLKNGARLPNRGKGFLYSYLLIPEDVKVLREWRLWLKAQDERAGVQVLVAHDIDAYQASSLQAW